MHKRTPPPPTPAQAVHMPHGLLRPRVAVHRAAAAALRALRALAPPPGATASLGLISHVGPPPRLLPGGGVPSPSPSPSPSSPPGAWFPALLAAALLRPRPAHARSAQPDSSTAGRLLESLHNGDGTSPLPGGGATATVVSARGRVVAVGDVHGDVSALRAALRAASVIDAEDGWVGGATTLVQLGDTLDRGPDELAVLNLLFRLQDSAPAAGGRVCLLVGNHELMNAALDFRYVSPAGFRAFSAAAAAARGRPRKAAAAGGVDGSGNGTAFGARVAAGVPDGLRRAIRALPPGMRDRARAVAAGGPLMSELGARSVVGLIVNDTVFVHGGLRARHVLPGSNGGFDDERVPRALRARNGLDGINAATRAFLQGRAPYPRVLRGEASPVWMRDYSRIGPRRAAECGQLRDLLRVLGVRRMVVGHTVQPGGLTAACGGRVWRIDTGMSKAYGGKPEAIEIQPSGAVRVFTTRGVTHGSARCQ